MATRVFEGVPGTPEYQRGAEWAGVCFATYNAVAFLFSFGLIALSRRYSAKRIHTVCLLCGAVGLLSITFIASPQTLLLSMVGVGIAWASILSMPYAMLSNVIPAEKMGFYMGVFNFFIVLPQIFAALGLGKVVQIFLSSNAAIAVALGGASMLVAAFALRFVDEER